MAAEGLGKKEIFTEEAINVQASIDNSDSKSDVHNGGKTCVMLLFDILSSNECVFSAFI